jgi:acetylornithine/succinyldiaminopimelate/putrescine aminotransferase
MIGLEVVEKTRFRICGVGPGGLDSFVNRLHEAGVLTIPSGTQRLRLPALNLSRAQAEEGLGLIESAVKQLC